MTVQADWATAWVIVRGDVDLAVAGRVDTAVSEALQNHPRKVHLVLSGVTSVDPPGAAVLAGLEERVCAEGSKLVLHCRTSPARDELVQEGVVRTWSTKVASLLRREGRGGEVTTVAVS